MNHAKNKMRQTQRSLNIEEARKNAHPMFRPAPNPIDVTHEEVRHLIDRLLQPYGFWVVTEGSTSQEGGVIRLEGWTVKDSGSQYSFVATLRAAESGVISVEGQILGLEGLGLLEETLH